MTGEQFSVAATEINGGASIGETLLFQFGNLGKSLIEQRRPWMVLRKTDSSKSVTAATTWQTAIDLSTISDFNRFYIDTNDPYPIRLWDGGNRIEKYRIVPFRRRLEFREIGNTAVYDAANKNLYLNGTVELAGTLYINYLKNGSDFNQELKNRDVLESDSKPTW